MLIDLNPSSPSSPVGAAATETPRSDASSRGISDLPSSMVSSDNPTMEFISWLGEKLTEIWNSILACFCSSEATVREIPSEERLQKGVGIIDSHFNRFSGEFYSKLDPLHSGIIVIIKYNGQFKRPLFLSVCEGKNPIRAESQRQLHELHAENSNNPNFLLEIDTFLIEKHEGSFKMDWGKDTLEDKRGLYHDSHKGNLFSNQNVDFVFQQLRDALPVGQHQERTQEVFDFVRNL